MIDTEKVEQIRARQAEIMVKMSDHEVATDPKQMMELAREHQTLKLLLEAIDNFESAVAEIADLKAMVNTETDPEMVEFAREELRELEDNLPTLEEELRMQLIPRNPEDAKDAIVEIRAGTGGDEASLFAGDLFKMYERFAEISGWKIELLAVTDGTMGGYKELVFGVHGADAFGTMRYESGVHRVQRVPATESSGRIHTSAATVAVLPEAEEVDITISENDLKVDVYRSSGPGGQSVNTTDSAVRITHIPTGIVVSIQDEKSQHKNKDKAMRVLRSRLYELELEKLHAERSEARKTMVGSGDRSAKIRTYNWPQGRVTDHRLEGDDKNHALQAVLNGELISIIRALRMSEHADQLANF